MKMLRLDNYEKAQSADSSKTIDRFVGCTCVKRTIGSF